jgi:hypothetical protein
MAEFCIPTIRISLRGRLWMVFIGHGRGSILHNIVFRLVEIHVPSERKVTAPVFMQGGMVSRLKN